MNRLPFFWRITERYLRGRRAGLDDIARDYDRSAATYARTWQAFMAPVSRDILGLLAVPPGGRILDLGCGMGLVLDYLRQGRFEGQYTGIDASAGMLARLARAPDVTILQGDVHDLLPALADRTFDAVTALWSWEYMDRRSLLPQIRRILRPGGQAILLANRRDTIPELSGAFLRLMERQPGHIRNVFHLGMRMPRDTAQMAREVSRAGLAAGQGIEGEQVKQHGSARDAIAWGFQTGALAGTRCVLDLPDLEARLAETFAGEPPFRTTHRYAGVTGVRPC
jgi:SAM-dependent methyltransferase